MGEYAKYNGHEVKIGTCEDMYYLRADQAMMVQPINGNVDPACETEQKVLRFRFPWPDEDDVEPGAFKSFDRGVSLHGVSVPSEVEHSMVQFHAEPGYLVSLPCPEGRAASHGLAIARNGFAGPVRIVQQGYRNGNLAVICACGGCGARYNLPTLEDARPIIEACRREADNRSEGARGFWRTVADRIEAGYGEPSVCLAGNPTIGDLPCGDPDCVCS